MISVILCGGVGARLWPLSRSCYPKQFLQLSSDKSLLGNTLQRAEMCLAHYFIANEEHRFLVAEQKRLAGLEGRILLEPKGRNTAPAIAAAAFQACADGYADEPMLILPSDHLIQDQTEFVASVYSAESYARDGKIVTLGIRPTRPETGYGYIARGGSVEGQGDASWIECFVEKPDKAKAQCFFESGEYLWNSGIYIVTPRVYLSLLKRFAEEVYFALEGAIVKSAPDNDFVRLCASAFELSPHISIDKAIMEPLCAAEDKASVVLPFGSGWSDLGSWASLWEIAGKDEDDNSAVGDVLLHEVSNSYVHSSGRLVAVVGLDDAVVVESADAVLVASKRQVQDVKFIVEQLKEEQRSEYLHHREVYRPWGKFDLIEQGAGYQVKRIVVDAGQSLSLQRHKYRSEHWVVVKGVAEVTRGEVTYLVSENESTYISVGEIHSLKNPTQEPLVIIEVQSGAYLGEDDIERFEDRYGRNCKG